MKKISLMLLIPCLVYGSIQNLHANDECVEQRIQSFRDNNGEDAWIRHDILGEWENDCASETNGQATSIVQNDTPDFDIFTSQNSQGSAVIIVQAAEDNVVIRNVVANREVCTLSVVAAYQLRGGFNLRFGQELNATFQDCSISNIREVVVTSDRGSFKYDLSRN